MRESHLLCFIGNTFDDFISKLCQSYRFVHFDVFRLNTILLEDEAKDEDEEEDERKKVKKKVKLPEVRFGFYRLGCYKSSFLSLVRFFVVLVASGQR